jgi:hypothetical protein
MPSWAFAIEYGATSMPHAKYTAQIKTTSAQLHGARWSPHQFAVPPFPAAGRPLRFACKEPACPAGLLQ